MKPIHITTINPVMPGLRIRIILAEDPDEVYLDDVLNAGGAYSGEIDAPDDIVVLQLTDDEGELLIQCRVPVASLSPMECFMTNPPKLNADELHKRWRKKYREMQSNGIKKPDPEAVARAAFKF